MQTTRLASSKETYWVNSSTFKAKAYKCSVRHKVEYCSSLGPIQALRITVHIRSKGYSAAWLYGACANIMHLASPTCLKTWDGVSQSIVGLAVGSWPSLRLPWGSSLITVTGYYALSCTEHVSRSWKVSSHFKLACPLSIYPFLQEQLFSRTIFLLLSLVNTAL